MADPMEKRYAEMAKRRAPILEELSYIDKDEKHFIVNIYRLIAIVQTQKKFFLDFAKKTVVVNQIPDFLLEDFDDLNENIISVMDDAISDYEDLISEKTKESNAIREQLMLHY